MFLLGSTVDVFVSDDNVFTGLFYQDKLMKFNFQSYPEVLMVDSTYKLNDLRMPLYLMMIVDGNGQSEVVYVPHFFGDQRSNNKDGTVIQG